MALRFSLKWKSTTSVFLIVALLTACGGSSNKSATPNADTTPPDAPNATSFQRLTGGRVVVTGSAEAGSTVKVTFADNSTA